MNTKDKNLPFDLICICRLFIQIAFLLLLLSHFSFLFAAESDIIKPALSITKPVQQALLNSSGFKFEGTASDASGIDRLGIVIYDYGRKIGVEIKNDISYNPSTKVWSYQILPQHVTLGQRARLYIYAYDKAGNVATLSTIVEVAAGPKEINPKILEPAQDLVTLAETGFLVSGSVQDVSEVQTLSVKIEDMGRGGAQTNFDDRRNVIYDASNAKWSYLVKPEFVTPGSDIIFKLSAKNQNDQWVVVSKKFSIVKKNSPPAIQSINGVPGENASAFLVKEGNQLRFDITAADPDQADKVLVHFSATVPPSGAGLSGVPANPARYQFTWTPGYDQAGSYLLRVRCKDDKGNNSETVHQINIQVKDVELRKTNLPLVDRLIAEEQLRYDDFMDFVKDLDFEDVYSHFMRDDFLKMILAEGFIREDLTTLSALKNAIAQKGIDSELLKLRPDGILQELVNPVKGSLLRVVSTDRSDVLIVRAELKRRFEENRLHFLSQLSDVELLKLLGAQDGDINNPFKPLYAFSKRGDVSNLSYVYNSVRPGFASLITDGNKATEAQILDYLKRADIAQNMTNLTNAMPEGKRAMRVGGEIIASLFDASGNEIVDEKGHPITLDTIAGENGKIFYGPWMDNWESTMKKRFEAFFDAYKKAGGKLDYIIVDLEEADASVMSHFYLNGQGPGIWQAILNDPRWPALSQKIGMSTAEMQQNIKPNGVFGGSSSNPTDAGLKWSIAMERHRIHYLHAALYSVVHKYFPNALSSSFEDDFRSDAFKLVRSYRYTDIWNGLGGMDAGTHNGFIPSANMRNGLPSLDGAPATMLQNLIFMIHTIKAGAAVSELPNHPVMASPDYVAAQFADLGEDGKYQAGEEPPYFIEGYFHAALNGAIEFTYQNGTLFTSRAGHELTDRMLKELNDPALFAYKGRRTIVFKPLSYQDELVVSGMKANGRLVYRVSWEAGKVLNDVLQQNADELVFQSGVSTFKIPGGRIYEPAGGSISKMGAWVVVDDPSAGKLLSGPVSQYLS